MHSFSAVYSTCATRDEAISIAKSLLEARLIACANITGADSLYRWEGSIAQASEAVLWVKTQTTLAPDVIAHIKARHSYQLPCIVALPIESGEEGFLQWIAEETAR